MKKILLTGREGMIGWELERALASLGTVFAFDRKGFDLSDPIGMRKTLREYHPDIIVNAAAYTAVDQAEFEKEAALAINGIAPGILAEEAYLLNAKLIHYSTDYVFDGTKFGSYKEEDQPNPLNYYGESKLVGEKAIASIGGDYLILRTSWIFGNRKKNFLTTMQQLGLKKESLSIVNDQAGAPTWCRFIAEATAQILSQKKDSLSGIYHLSASGKTSWFQFAEAIFNSGMHGRPKLSPIPSKDYPSPAKRPQNSVLDNSKVGKDFGISIPDWQTGLALCLANQ
jgi:dTDP-4-dehydrorhamnose reductase